MMQYNPDTGQWFDDGVSEGGYSSPGLAEEGAQAQQQWQTQPSVDAAIAAAEEERARATAAAQQPGGVVGPTGSSGDFGQAWLASGKQTLAEFKAFAEAWNAAHPTDLVTLGGSKGDKATYRGRTYDAVLAAGLGGQGATWSDITDGAAGGSVSNVGQAIDPSYLESFDESFQAPGGATPPNWTPPPAFAYQDFEGFDPWSPTTAEDVYRDPSFAFRRDQGVGAIEAGAASRGLINSGGTLKDLLKFGQEFASQEYGNIDNRRFGVWDQSNRNKFDTYGTNRSNAASNYMTNYGVDRDTFDIQNSASNQSYDRAWDQYLNRQDTHYRNQEGPFRKIMSLSELGMQAGSY